MRPSLKNFNDNRKGFGMECIARCPFSEIFQKDCLPSKFLYLHGEVIFSYLKIVTPNLEAHIVRLFVVSSTQKTKGENFLTTP